MPRSAPVLRRLGAALATAAVLTVGLAGAASAHVTVEPESAPKGGSATFTFRVPNEEDGAATVKIVIAFPDPTTAPLAVADVEPHPGWTYVTDTTHLATPAESDDGPISDVVSQITWTADAGGGIKPGEFDEFKIEVDPLPTKVDTLEFKVLQTYSNGDVVRWIEATPAGGTEPEHPAPTVTLTAGGDTSTTTAAGTPTTTARADSGSDDGVSGPVVVALVLGGLGLAVAVVALVVARRRGST
jgi:uncharacterized protein YcnI